MHLVLIKDFPNFLFMLLLAFLLLILHILLAFTPIPILRALAIFQGLDQPKQLQFPMQKVAPLI